MKDSLSALIVGISIILAGWVIGQNMNHTAVISNGGLNSISVSGDGKVFAKPDTFLLTVLAQEKAKTTKEAFAKTNGKIILVQKLLTDAKIKEEDVQSVNININPNYNYENSKTTIDGFIANHGLSIKIRNLESIDTILEGVSAIDGIQIQSTSYDVDDKTELYKRAREMAIKKAKQKADDMAKASGITLGKVTSMSENQYTSPMPYANQYMEARVDMSAGNGVGVSLGQLEISTSVSINYEIK